MKRMLLVIAVLSIFLFVGCSNNIEKDAVTEIFIEKDNVEELEIDLDVSYAEVTISSGADDWMNGTIDYNSSSFEPEVTYKASSKKGKIKIDQPKSKASKAKGGEIENYWDLQVTNDIPIDLEVETGASDAHLDLRGMKLNKVNVDSGVGRTTVDLSGSWDESFSVNLEMGLGQTNVILPKEVGVQIHTEKGLAQANFVGFISEGDGVYVNEAFKDADIVITVDTEIGLGEVNFELKN